MSFGSATVSNNDRHTAISGTGNTGSVTKNAWSTINAENSQLQLTRNHFADVTVINSNLQCTSCHHSNVNASGGRIRMEEDRFGDVTSEGDSKITMSGNKHTDLTSNGTECFLERNSFTSVNSVGGTVRITGDHHGEVIAKDNSNITMTDNHFTDLTSSGTECILERNQHGNVKVKGSSRINMTDNRFTDLTSNGTECILKRNKYSSVNTKRGNVTARDNSSLTVSGTNGSVIIENTKRHEIKPSLTEAENKIMFVPRHVMNFVESGGVQNNAVSGGNSNDTISSTKVSSLNIQSVPAGSSMTVSTVYNSRRPSEGSQSQVTFSGYNGESTIINGKTVALNGSGSFSIDGNGNVTDLSRTFESGKRIVEYFGRAEIHGNEYQTGIFSYKVDHKGEELLVTVNGKGFKQGSIQIEALSSSAVRITAVKADVRQVLIIEGPEVEGPRLTNGTNAKILVSVRIPRST